MTDQNLDHRFAEAMGQLIGPDFPKTIGLAVSGGGDSMAMLALAHNWTRVWGARLRVVTVDHGLRPESAQEAAMVAAECAALGHRHDTLRWQWDGSGNVQDAARRARLELIGAWATDIVDHVCMAHTADDVAETFLIRLARGSGVDGLAAMLARRPVPGFEVIRPCLDVTRAELRHYAKTLHVPWVDDPSNDDPKYARVRARAALPELAKLGLGQDDIITTARRMRRAADALRARALSVADDIATEAAGAVKFDRAGFDALEADTQLRLLAASLCWVSSDPYRPRASALESLLDTLLAGGAGTLHGAKAETTRDAIWVCREYDAVRRQQGPLRTDADWDARWQITGPRHASSDYVLAPVGEALKEIADWRAAGLPRSALIASPGIWRNGSLVAAPVLGDSPDWTARIVTSFATFLKTH